jgi:hypothetical protein
MARIGHRERAIQEVIHTGRTPGRNVKRSEFCDLVRAAAQVQETGEGLPRGWTNAAIMKATMEISRSPAVLCKRCKTEVSLANALDAEPDVDRRRRELAAGDQRRVLSRTEWAIFEVLYAALGSPVSTDFLVTTTVTSGLREHIRKLRRALIGSRYRIETHRGIGYSLTVGPR